MAPAPKKSAPASRTKKSPVKPRLSQTEAESLIIQAAIDLILTTPPANITVHMISNQAGVHHDYIARYFGSREEVLIQATEQVVLGVSTNLRMSTPASVLDGVEGTSTTFEMAGARYRLIAYLLSCGVSPERFVPSQKILLDLIRNAYVNPHLTDRTKNNLTHVMTLILQSIHTVSAINDMTEQESTDVMNLFFQANLYSEMLQEKLGWDEPTPKKKKQPRLNP
jgi:AcrR family transcriptional regulator